MLVVRKYAKAPDRSNVSAKAKHAHTYLNGPDGRNAVLIVVEERPPGQDRASVGKLGKMAALTKRKPLDCAIHIPVQYGRRGINGQTVQGHAMEVPEIASAHAITN